MHHHLDQLNIGPDFGLVLAPRALGLGGLLNFSLSLFADRLRLLFPGSLGFGALLSWPSASSLGDVRPSIEWRV